MTEDTGVDRAAVWWRLLTLAADHKLPIPQRVAFNPLTSDTVWLEVDSLGDVAAWRNATRPTVPLHRFDFPADGLYQVPWAAVSFRFPLTAGDTDVQIDVRADGPASDPTGIETPS